MTLLSRREITRNRRGYQESLAFFFSYFHYNQTNLFLDFIHDKNNKMYHSSCWYGDEIELEERLDKSGKFDYLKTVKGLNEMANIVYIRQPYPKGDGDAILRAKNLIWDEPFLVLFWDDLIDNDPSAAQQLVASYEQKSASVIATIEVPQSEVSSYGILEWKKDDSLFSVARFFEKPKNNETTSRNAAIGKYVLTPSIFDYLEKAKITWYINDEKTRNYLMREWSIKPPRCHLYLYGHGFYRGFFYCFYEWWW